LEKVEKKEGEVEEEVSEGEEVEEIEVKTERWVIIKQKINRAREVEGEVEKEEEDFKEVEEVKEVEEEEEEEGRGEVNEIDQPKILTILAHHQRREISPRFLAHFKTNAEIHQLANLSTSTRQMILQLTAKNKNRMSLPLKRINRKMYSLLYRRIFGKAETNLNLHS
jgi:hypothetical protein